MKKPVKIATVCAGLMAGASLIIATNLFVPKTHGKTVWDARDFIKRETSLGSLALVAHAVGIGKIVGSDVPFVDLSEKTPNPFGYYTVKIETAFLGCTNNQVLRFYHWPGDELFMPAVNSNFVFVATTNNTFGIRASDLWDPVYHAWLAEGDGRGEGVPYFEEDYVPIEHKPMYLLKYPHRTFWYADDPEGQLPLQHLTNAMCILRATQPNWTNFYEFCRNGTTSVSERVKEDSEYNLLGLLRVGSTREQLEMMNNDPLFPESLKPFLTKELVDPWKKPKP